MRWSDWSDQPAVQLILTVRARPLERTPAPDLACVARSCLGEFQSNTLHQHLDSLRGQDTRSRDQPCRTPKDCFTREVLWSDVLSTADLSVLEGIDSLASAN